MQPIAAIMEDAHLDWESFQKEFNNTSKPYFRDKSVIQLFEENVLRFGNKIALYSDNEHYTYNELNEKANQLAHYLKKNAVGKGSFVALYFERSMHLIISMIAVIKTGAAYVSLDVEEPANRSKIILRDCQPSKILKQSKNNKLNALLEGEVDFINEVINVDDFFNNFSIEREQSPTVISPSVGDDLISVLYTSGTTGKPKGCMIPHRAVTGLVQDSTYLKITTDDTVAQICNPAFDVFTLEIWGSLLNGASLYIVPQEVLLSCSDFAVTLKNEKITVLIIATSILNLMVKNAPHGFDDLNYLIFGGEKANPEIIKILLKRKLKHKLHHLNIINSYGPAENTAITTTFNIESLEQIADTVPIGRPISNRRCYVLDENLKFVPAGVPGELYLAGDGLALGYLNEEKQTAAKFIKSPWDVNEKLYKTGDFVCWKPEVGLIYLERMDQQIKSRGNRVELGEIEACLYKYRSVSQAAVAYEMRPNGDKQIVAYVSFRYEDKNHFEKLYQYLTVNIPYYMLPTKIVQVDNIPLTNNGKIDKKHLVNLPGRILRNYAVEKPQKKLEKVITNMCCELLGILEIDVSRNFFEFGLHSLMLEELCQKLNTKFRNKIRTQVKILDILTYPNVRDLAKHLEDEQGQTPFIALNDAVNRASKKRHQYFTKLAANNRMRAS